MEMKLKEKLKNATYLSQEEINMFDYIYFIPTRRKHDSGYYMYEVYGGIYDEDEKKTHYYSLSKCSDVLDFEPFIYSNYCSIDSPEYGVFRLFSHSSKYKFLIPLFHCSSFIIKIREV